jgi:hypothetical protein
MITPSRTNLNTGNTFACVSKQLPELNLDNTYLLHTDTFSEFRLYLPDKI